MKVVALVSGGKDSCYAMMRCIDYGHEVVALANLMPLDDSIDELDSYMYQTVGHQIVSSYAECMGLPLFRRRIQGSTRHLHLSYAATEGDEVEDLFILLSEVKRQIPSVIAVASGAIASDYQRLRVENVCARLGLVSLAYLWKQDQTFLLDEMIRRGIMAITVKVASMGLNPAKHLGKELRDLKSHLLEMKELFGINVCGEGGEYESLTLDCPLFTNARIVLDNYQVVLHSPGSIASVGILHPLAFHLEQKEALSFSCHSGSDAAGLKEGGLVCEVHGDVLPDLIVRSQSEALACDNPATKKLNLCFSTTKRETFSIGCWSQGSSNTSEGLQEDLIAVLRQIESELHKHGFDWVNVLYIHLYISDMKQFALANEVYMQFITEKNCNFGVPSRSTVELPLVQLGLGNAYIEVLVANDHKKRVLHVQSISCWAPSCIGPYSQATFHGEVLYMAGQLGLDPPTMMLKTGGPVAEIEQALKNCDEVANCFNGSLASSSMLVVIYCSVSLTSCERTEIEICMEYYLSREVSASQNVGSLRAYDPIFLYVLVPNLPKGALVEVKPVLHIPENVEDEFQIVVPQTVHTVIPDNWSFANFGGQHDTCIQKWRTCGKLCSAVVSVTKEVLANLFSITEEIPPNFPYGTIGKHLKEVIEFCLCLLDKFLSENSFSWEDLKSLRFYYRTDLFVTAENLSTIFSEVFNEFAEISSKIEIGQDAIFNLLPVLGSGRSACMDDLMTCELFAVRT